MKFTKMNGAGNDFIILENFDGAISQAELPQLARTLCDRHLSIGADGLMVVSAAKHGADYAMLFYNADGSLGEMCGNGARCICRYGYENGLAGQTQRVETTAGLVTGQRMSRREYQIRLPNPTVLKLDYPVEVEHCSYRCAYVELGDPGLPHAVVEYPNLRQADEQALFALGKKLRYHPAFAKGANVNFYELIDKDTVYERTWERGVEDFTYACGSGTGSVAAVLTLQGRCSGALRAQMRGGELTVQVLQKDGEICDLYLTGPTNLVARGDVLDEELPGRFE